MHTPPDKTAQHRIYSDAIRNAGMDMLPTGVTRKKIRRAEYERVQEEEDVRAENNRALLEVLLKDKKFRDAKKNKR